jgi:hypothetical protein
MLFLSLPILSEDYLRFLWDGHLIHAGINPFNYTPTEIISNGLLSPEYNAFGEILYDGMNSKVYYSLYPPLNQWLFWLASSPENLMIGVTIMRIAILIADVSIYFALIKILKRFKLPTANVILYWLNPLILIEGVGNVHMEIIMVAFFVWSLHFLSRIEDTKASITLPLSLLSKVYSLFAFPLLFLKNQWFRNKKILLLAIPIMITAYWPFVNHHNILNILSSFELYVNRFEFNGSLYNLLKWLGYQVYDYNIIRTLGPILTAISMILMLWISYKNRYRNRLEMFTVIQYIFLIFLCFSPVVHPWYLILPLTLSAVSNINAVILWSFTIMFSYHAYQYEQALEKSYWLIIEYVPVGALLINDLIIQTKKRLPTNS